MELRSKSEIAEEVEAAKLEVAIIGTSRDDPKDQDIWEAYYQYWRGIRNALNWVLYPGMETPIRSDRQWELGKEPLGEPKDLAETRERLRRT